jgi:hypothetical protein
VLHAKFCLAVCLQLPGYVWASVFCENVLRAEPVVLGLNVVTAPALFTQPMLAAAAAVACAHAPLVHVPPQWPHDWHKQMLVDLLPLLAGYHSSHNFPCYVL